MSRQDYMAGVLQGREKGFGKKIKTDKERKMKKTIIMILVLAVAAMLILAFGGCKNVASDFVEKAIEDAAAKEGEDVDIDIDEGKVSITDEEGNEISIGGTDIPDGWPAEIPVDNN